MVRNRDQGCAALRLEIAAFYSGFGQPNTLCAAFEQAVLLGPLTDDGRLYVSEFGGVDWVCTFTSVQEFARNMTARGVEPEHAYRYQAVLGQRIIGAAQRARPTAVAVDIGGAAPMAFPPELTVRSGEG